jgi:hypothetical protein
MMSLTGVIVAGATGAIIAAPMFQLTVMQAQSRSQLEARVLWQSEIERARQLWSLNYNDFDLVELNNSKNCTKGTSHAYTEQGFVFDVQCRVGRQSVGDKTVLLPYPAVSRNPGQYSDNDGNGFEDVTGLPTHYDQCYAGWKGDGYKHSNCILGGQYVIPMYANLYVDGAPVNVSTTESGG